VKIGEEAVMAYSEVLSVQWCGAQIIPTGTVQNYGRTVGLARVPPNTAHLHLFL
jgi:hypothetical protein